jgi:hypothetical protein
LLLLLWVASLCFCEVRIGLVLLHHHKKLYCNTHEREEEGSENDDKH